ncbi:MAG: hypothetical protein EOO43_11220, partial [Flavobacterium sp.]
MKILFVYTALPKGGIETFFVRMARELFEKGYSVNFLFFSNNLDKEILSELKLYSNVFQIDDYIFLPEITRNFSPLIKLLIPLKRKKLAQDILEEVGHI